MKSTTIYTSYFAMIRKFPDNIEPVSIARVTPKFFQGKKIESVMPTSSILWEYKQNPDKERYIKRYEREVLSKLNIDELNQIFNSILQESGKEHIALICYEKSSDFCHRHILARWLNERGIECKEFIP